MQQKTTRLDEKTSFNYNTVVSISMTTATKTNEKVYKDVVPGAKVRVSLKIKDTNKKGEEKERIQVFEGMVISRKHGSEIGSTITVRKMSGNIGVEKIIPLRSPVVAGIEVIAKYRVRQAVLGHLRNPKFKKKLKEIKGDQPKPKKKAAKTAAPKAKAEPKKAETPSSTEEKPTATK